jgi:hypothetical protein
MVDEVICRWESAAGLETTGHPFLRLDAYDSNMAKTILLGQVTG